jgi:hypothetical protein
VPHTCNPSYSGGSDQEDLPQFEASLGKQFSKPYLEKNPSPIERAGGVSQGVGPEFKSQYCKGKKKKEWCERVHGYWSSNLYKILVQLGNEDENLAPSQMPG